MGKRIVLFLMCLLVVIGHLSAQVTKMSGIVLSKDDGLPVVGASVLIQGTTHGTITDVDGKFVLDNGEFYQFNLSSCIRQQNSLTAQFVSFSLSNLANIFYPPQFLQ